MSWISRLLNRKREIDPKNRFVVDLEFQKKDLKYIQRPPVAITATITNKGESLCIRTPLRGGRADTRDRTINVLYSVAHAIGSRWATSNGEDVMPALVQTTVGDSCFQTSDAKFTRLDTPEERPERAMLTHDQAKDHLLKNSWRIVPEMSPEDMDEACSELVRFDKEYIEEINWDITLIILFRWFLIHGYHDAFGELSSQTWAYAKTRFVTMTSQLQESMTPEERLKMWSELQEGYCKECGKDKTPCYCSSAYDD